jgi:hypothetical protein
MDIALPKGLETSYKKENLISARNARLCRYYYGRFTTERIFCINLEVCTGVIEITSQIKFLVSSIYLGVWADDEPLHNQFINY